MSGRVLAVAHRGGNSLPALEAAALAGVDIVELDLQPGRLEVRHARDLSPLPLLVDRGRLTRGWGPRLYLDRLLDAAAEVLPATTRLLIDLKGTRTAIGAQLAEVLVRQPWAGGVLVCGLHWPALEAVARVPEVGVLLSAGNAAELSRLRRHVADGHLIGGRRAYGASIRHGLVTPMLTQELAPALELVLAWTVNRDRDLARVLAAGVGGVISDSPAVLRAVAHAVSPADQPGTTADQPGTTADQPGTTADQPGTTPGPGGPPLSGQDPGV